MYACIMCAYTYLQTALVEKAIGKAQNGRMGPVVGKHNSLVQFGNLPLLVQFMKPSNQ